MLMSEVQVHQLRREVQVRVAVIIPERRTRRRCDRHWLDVRLSAPRMKDVCTIVGANLLFSRLIRQCVRCASSVSVRRHVGTESL